MAFPEVECAAMPFCGVSHRHSLSSVSIGNDWFVTLIWRAYAVLFSDRWHERYYAGDDPAVNEGIMIGLYPAAIIGAILVSLALRVLTKKWDKEVLLLLMVAGVLTIPLSKAIASLIAERNFHLILFPVGEAFFSALSGYWLVRVSPVEEHIASFPATAREPHQRPA